MIANPGLKRALRFVGRVRRDRPKESARVRLTGALPNASFGPLRTGGGGMCVLTSAGLWSLGADGEAYLSTPAADAAVIGEPLNAYDVGTRLLFASVRDAPSIWLRRGQGPGAELWSK